MVDGMLISITIGIDGSCAIVKSFTGTSRDAVLMKGLSALVAMCDILGFELSREIVDRKM